MQNDNEYNESNDECINVLQYNKNKDIVAMGTVNGGLGLIDADNLDLMIENNNKVVDLDDDFEKNVVDDDGPVMPFLTYMKDSSLVPLDHFMWLPQPNQNHFFMTLDNSSRCFNLWKYSSASSKVSIRRNFYFSHYFSDEITGLSLQSDSETFITSNSEQVHLWSLQRSVPLLTVLNPSSSSSNTITVCKCSPSTPHVFYLGTNTGHIIVGDCRSQRCIESDMCVSLSHSQVVPYKYPICDIDPKLDKSDDLIFSVDFLNLYYWDIRVTEKCLRTVPIQDEEELKRRHTYRNIPRKEFSKVSVNANRELSCVVAGGYNSRITISSFRGYNDTDTLSTTLNYTVIKSDYNNITTTSPGGGVQDDEYYFVPPSCYSQLHSVRNIQWNNRNEILYTFDKFIQKIEIEK